MKISQNSLEELPTAVSWLSRMGPQFFNRGNMRAVSFSHFNQTQIYWPLSIGPQFFNRGNHSATADKETTNRFQWGRSLSTP